jgi:hypothetical protein
MGKLSLASLTKTNNTSRGYCCTIQGIGGLGKTTLGAEACLEQEGIMVLSEDGLSRLDLGEVVRTPVIESWTDFKDFMLDLVMTENPIKTVVFDTMDGFTTLLDKHVVATVYGGNEKEANNYKSKYNEMITEFNGMLEGFSILQNRGVNIICLVHSVIETHKSPDTESYTHYTLALPGGPKTSTANALYDYSDFVFFAKRDVTVSDKQGKGGQHVLMTKWTPAYEAKTRVDKKNPIPEKLPMTWEAIKPFLK